MIEQEVPEKAAPVRVLVVDDEPDLETLIRQRFRRQIRDGEFEFFFAQDGEEALAVLQQQPGIDIVLTDINMPRMDGLTLLARLSELDRLLKSVVISAYGDMENIRTAMNRGAFDFLTKPIDFSDLEVTMRKTVQEIQDLRAGVLAERQLLTVQQELEVAARIQQSMLPKQVLTAAGERKCDLHATMYPAREIGGDFYDYFWVEENRLAIVIGDVAGKGVPAALYMAVTRTLLKAVAGNCVATSDCLKRVNELLVSENRSDLFVTLVYGILDLRTGAFIYSNAGHNLPYHLKEDAITPLENQGGIVLGVLGDVNYATTRVHLTPGDVIFLYTDGVTETMNEDGEMFGEERLESILKRHNECGCKELLQHVTAAVREFGGKRAQHDDITMLALRYVGAWNE